MNRILDSFIISLIILSCIVFITTCINALKFKKGGVQKPNPDVKKQPVNSKDDRGISKAIINTFGLYAPLVIDTLGVYILYLTYINLYVSYAIKYDYDPFRTTAEIAALNGHDIILTSENAESRAAIFENFYRFSSATTKTLARVAGKDQRYFMYSEFKETKDSIDSYTNGRVLKSTPIDMVLGGDIKRCVITILDAQHMSQDDVNVIDIIKRDNDEATIIYVVTDNSDYSDIFKEKVLKDSIELPETVDISFLKEMRSTSGKIYREKED